MGCEQESSSTAKWGASGHRPPESSSMSELVERNAVVAAAAGSVQAAPVPATVMAAPASAAPAAPTVPTGPPAGVGIVFKESRRNSTSKNLGIVVPFSSV
jgi:hypothetical protein